MHQECARCITSAASSCFHRWQDIPSSLQVVLGSILIDLLWFRGLHHAPEYHTDSSSPISGLSDYTRYMKLTFKWIVQYLNHSSAQAFMDSRSVEMWKNEKVNIRRLIEACASLHPEFASIIRFH